MSLEEFPQATLKLHTKDIYEDDDDTQADLTALLEGHTPYLRPGHAEFLAEYYKTPPPTRQQLDKLIQQHIGFKRLDKCIEIEAGELPDRFKSGTT